MQKRLSRLFSSVYKPASLRLVLVATAVPLQIVGSVPIVNPSFESGTVGWSNNGGVFDASPPGIGMFADPVPHGASVLFLGGKSPGPAFASQQLNRTVRANTNYILSFWVGLRAEPYIQPPSSYSVALLPFASAANCGLPARGRFIRCSLSFTASANDAGLPLTIRIDVAGPNAVHQLAFDDFTLQAIAITSVVPIVNPSFESGTTGWSNNGGVFDASPPGIGMFADPVPHGASVLFLGGKSPGPAFASQQLNRTVRANTNYILSFWVGLRAEPYIQPPSSYSVSLLPFANTTNCGLPARGRFIRCSLSFTASANDAGLPLTIRIDVAGPNAVHQLAFDHFILQAIPVVPIVNPSFESGTMGWSNNGGVFDASPPGIGMFADPVPHGASVLFLGGKSPGPAFASQQLNRTVQANTNYILSFWVGLRAEPYIQPPSSYSIALLPFASAANCGLPARGRFIRCSLSFTASANDAGLPLTIRIDVAGPNAVHQLAFDDFTLQAIAITSVVPIVNPSFESGTTGWSNNGGVFDASPPGIGMFADPVPHGASVLFLGGKSPGPAFASQQLNRTVRANTNYILSFWVGLRAEPYIRPPSSYSVSLLPFANTTNCGLPARGRFIRCSLSFTASANDAGLPLTIRIDVAGPNAVHQLAFDHFILQAIPVVPIVNPSFESGTMGWSNNGGVFDASPPGIGMFADPVPHGASVLFLGGKSPGPAFASQQLNRTVQANTNYILSFWVGLRAEPYIQPPSSYSIALLPFASAANCGLPARGRFIRCSLSFTASANDAGLPLTIRIDVAGPNAVHQLAFDDFTLQVVP